MAGTSVRRPIPAVVFILLLSLLSAIVWYRVLNRSPASTPKAIAPTTHACVQTPTTKKPATKTTNQDTTTKRPRPSRWRGPPPPPCM